VFKASVFDKILTHKRSDQHIVANTYLHLLGTCPEFLEQYKVSKKSKIWLRLRYWLVAIIKISHSIFNKKHYSNQQLNVDADILFVSHLTNNKQILQDGDAYFGDLPNQLLEQGIGSSVALINHTKSSSQDTLNGWKGSDSCRFVLSSSLSFLCEVKLYLTQKKTKRLLKSILKDLHIDKTLANNILFHHLSPGVFNSLRIARQVTDIANQTGAKFVITTYEGHAWERLVYYYVRKTNPNIKCFGYQHAAVFECQHAIKRPLSVEYNPDIILTSGLIAKDILRQWWIKEEGVVCIGSPKYSMPSTMINKSQTCLVVPTYFVKECLDLFQFSLIYAKKHQDQKFIWRLHPLISFEKLKKYSSIFKELPNNIRLSEGDLKKDIRDCDSVLYRTSTVVVNAVNSGLNPIYYQQSFDEVNIDPIYTHKEGKSIVHNQEELGLALDRDIDAKTRQFLQDFAQDFYTPLDVSALLKELKRSI
jgi:hypothetical protein